MNRLLYRALPWLVFAGSLGLTGLLWQHEVASVHGNLRAAFDFSLRDAASRIEQRMAAYEQMLRGAQGLFAVTGIRHQDFPAYVASLQLGGDFSGIQGIGVSFLVPREGRLDHERDVRRRLPAYAIAPPGERDVYAPIIYLAPAVGRNLQAVGYDPLSSPPRRLAMEQARDSGAAAISAKVRLATEPDTGGQAGFVMYLPLFRSDQTPATRAARRDAIVGWVFAGVRMDDLMASLYGERPAGTTLRIYDGVELTPESLMFDAGGAPGPAGLEATEYITVAGHTWTMVFRSGPGFEERYNSGAPRVIVVAGLGLGLLAALLAWQLINGRNHALALAMKMTRELREGEERMRHMAQHDPLTHLPNRALFSDRLSQAIATARRKHGRLALMFVDLDHFKPVNDSYGHAVGDLLLQDLASRLQACLRESDSAGRVGGDEFVVLLPDIAGAEDALPVAEKIRAALGRPMAVGDRMLQVSASIGVAVFPEHGEDEIRLSKSADDAMYRAKAAGRDRVALAV